MSVSEEQKKNERKTFHEKALHGLATVGCYVVRLRVNPNYWSFGGFPTVNVQNGTIIRTLHSLNILCIKNHCRKVKETTGLQLTKVQEVYWRAVQRRMILSQLESLINDHLELIKQREIKVPYELAMSLMKCDPGKLFIYTRKLHGR